MNTCSIPLPGRYVEVAPNARLADRRATLTYRVPEALEASTEVGQLIWAPLKKRIVLGIVVERHDREPATEHIRDIHAPVEPTFCLTPLQWRLAVWIAEQTVCTLYEAASVMLPPGVGSRAVEYLSLKRQPLTDEIDTLTPSQKRLVAFLSAEGERHWSELSALSNRRYGRLCQRSRNGASSRESRGSATGRSQG